MKFYAQLNEVDVCIGAQESPSEIQSAGYMEMPSYVEAEAAIGKHWDGEAWENVTQELTELNVSVRHYIMHLLGANVHGKLKTARLLLSSKVAAGTATETEEMFFEALDTAHDLLQLGDEINLLDPLVGSVLDIAVAIPAVPFTAEDKARVLRNEAIQAAA